MSQRGRARKLDTRRWNEATVTSPGAKRATLGLFDGAKVTIAGRPVRSGARASDYTNDELAALVAYFMRFNAQPSPEHGGALVYRGSIASALRALFDSAPPEQVKKQVSYALNRNGFRSITNGPGPEGFIGWRVGDLGTWLTAADVTGDEQTEGGPVTKRWLCGAKDCLAPGPYDTRDELNLHILVHAREAKKALWTCPECGFKGTLGSKAGHSKAHGYTSPLQQTLLDTVRERPGLHPRAYAELLGTSSSAIGGLARALRKKDALSATGKTEGTRYWPGATPPELVTQLLLTSSPDRTVVHTQERRVPKPKPAPAPDDFRHGRESRSRAATVSATTVTLVPLADGSNAVLLDGKLYRLVELS